MNRYRIRYKKTGASRYLAHLDLLRTIERSARRASLPLAFTEGFNPHPKISFAAPLPVGVEGYDEYLDLDLERPVEEYRVKEFLNASLPEGLKILEVKKVKEKSKSLMALVEKADYLARAELPGIIHQESIITSIKGFLDNNEIIIERKTPKGLKVKDIRPGILALRAEVNEGILLINMSLKTGSKENVRPDEVLCTFAEGYLPYYVENFRISRTCLHGSGSNSMWCGCA